LVFISELKLEEFSNQLQEVINCIINNIPSERLCSEHIIFDTGIFGLP